MFCEKYVYLYVISISLYISWYWWLWEYQKILPTSSTLKCQAIQEGFSFSTCFEVRSSYIHIVHLKWSRIPHEQYHHHHHHHHHIFQILPTSNPFESKASKHIKASILLAPPAPVPSWCRRTSPFHRLIGSRFGSLIILGPLWSFWSQNLSIFLKIRTPGIPTNGIWKRFDVQCSASPLAVRSIVHGFRFSDTNSAFQTWRKALASFYRKKKLFGQWLLQ